MKERQNLSEQLSGPLWESQQSRKQLRRLLPLGTGVRVGELGPFTPPSTANWFLLCWLTSNLSTRLLIFLSLSDLLAAVKLECAALMWQQSVNRPQTAVQQTCLGETLTWLFEKRLQRVWISASSGCGISYLSEREKVKVRGQGSWRISFWGREVCGWGNLLALTPNQTVLLPSLPAVLQRGGLSRLDVRTCGTFPRCPGQNTNMPCWFSNQETCKSELQVLIQIFH